MFFVICLFCFLNYKEKKKIKSNLAIVFVLFLSCQFCYSFFNSSSSISNDLKTNSYNIKLFTNGGTLINDLKINKDVILPNIKKNGFSFNGWKKMSDGYHAEWIDNIPPVITNFRVENLGYYNPSLGARAGWNIRIYVDAYDNGSGIRKYQTWLVPYKNGSGAGREDGGERILTNVLYLNTQEGRTFCAYAIDNAGNESEKCETIKV